MTAGAGKAESQRSKQLHGAPLMTAPRASSRREAKFGRRVVARTFSTLSASVILNCGRYFTALMPPPLTQHSSNTPLLNSPQANPSTSRSDVSLPPDRPHPGPTSAPPRPTAPTIRPGARAYTPHTPSPLPHSPPLPATRSRCPPARRHAPPCLRLRVAVLRVAVESRSCHPGELPPAPETPATSRDLPRPRAITAGPATPLGANGRQALAAPPPPHPRR